MTTHGKKALIVASVASMLDQFNRSNMSLLQEAGFEVHVAANFVRGSTTSDERVRTFSDELRAAGITHHHIDFQRTVWKSTHVRSYRSLSFLVRSQKFDLIHCHSPIGGALSRLVARRTGVPVIYTAHGFHFFRGSSALSWLLYYPIERSLARYTKTLITINKEDTARARKFACAVEYVPGVGVDCARFTPGDIETRCAKRRELNIPEEHFVMICAAELSTNKNQTVLLEAIPTIVQTNPDFTLLLAGEGPKRLEYEKLVDDLQIRPFVRFLGYREDIDLLYQAADAAALVSLREGLPMVVMEAMASGLPVVATSCRGNVDLFSDILADFLVPVKVDPIHLGRKILWLAQNPGQARRLGLHSISIIRENYSRGVVESRMREIYANAAS